jgi:neutral ceramidase
MTAMKNGNSLLFFAIFIGASLSIYAQKSLHANGIFSAGTAKIKITPGTPIPMSGFGGRDNPFSGVHDDLFARAIALSDGNNKALLIASDLIGISNAIWEATADRITKETGIKREYILLSAVHNHSGPVINVYETDSSAAVKAYISELINDFVLVSKEALGKMVAAKIGAGKGECRMNINRRASNGRGENILGQNPYGPCDHEAGIIDITDKSGAPVAILVDWPCHGVVLGPKNLLITADWPGATSRYIEDSAKGGVIAPVFIGASGDINPIYGPHIDFDKNSDYAFGKDAIGEDLGNEVLRVLTTIRTSSGGKISAVQRVISLPAKAKDNESFQRPESTQDDSVHVRLSVLKIGNIVLTGVSGEVFNQISVKMRKRSAYPFTFMVTHCNGSSGYLVSDDAYPKNGEEKSAHKYAPTGGYEASSTMARSGAEKGIIENLLSMIADLN